MTVIRKGRNWLWLLPVRHIVRCRKKTKIGFLPRRKSYLGFTRLTEVEQAAIRLYLNTCVDRKFVSVYYYSFLYIIILSCVLLFLHECYDAHLCLFHV